ncbi:hypothetical protein LSAT2_021767 [Lamellibrachia satsuma]|nr:hypothetical protein LSAT2_021767 [Lamellibrachia satsuma]
MQLFGSKWVIESIDMEHDEDMKRQVLEACRDDLCKNSRLTSYVCYLRSKFVVSREDDEEINAEKTTLKKNGKFLDIISTKGSRGYDEFCNAIKKDGTTPHLLEMLDNKLQKLRAEAGGEYDESADGLPNPGEPGAPPLPHPYADNIPSRPCSYNSSQA